MIRVFAGAFVIFTMSDRISYHLAAFKLGAVLQLLSVLHAGVALSTSDGSSLFGGYFHDSTCSTPYALAAHSYNLQTLAAAIKVSIISSCGVTLPQLQTCDLT